MNLMVFLKTLLLIAVTARPLPAQAEAEVFRLGMIGLDTSHVIAFTQIINNPKNNYGCKVVAGFPGGSPDMPASADRVEKFTSQSKPSNSYVKRLTAYYLKVSMAGLI